MTTLFARLVAQGVPEAMAAAGILEHIKQSQNDSELTVDVIQQLRTPAPVPVPQPPPLTEVPMVLVRDGRRIDHTSAQRVFAHVLLYCAYRLPAERLYSTDDIFRKMARVYRAYGRGMGETPTRNTLQNLCSLLRNGKVPGLPALAIDGPLQRTIQNDLRWAVKVYPRSAVKDQLDGVQLPNWVWPDLPVPTNKEQSNG